jgi:hypothetical protein
MRDDIHKSVPRPSAVQRWVRLSVNDADRVADRPFDGLQNAMRDACRREIKPDFVRELNKALNGPAQLFGLLSDVGSPRDLNGRGGPAEWEILGEAKRLCAKGVKPSDITQAAIASVMRNRIEADIRVTEAVLPRFDRKTPIVLDSMRSDAKRTDFSTFAESVCNGQAYEVRKPDRSLDLDGDMLPSRGRR